MTPSSSRIARSPQAVVFSRLVSYSFPLLGFQSGAEVKLMPPTAFFLAGAFGFGSLADLASSIIHAIAFVGVPAVAFLWLGGGAGG